MKIRDVVPAHGKQLSSSLGLAILLLLTGCEPELTPDDVAAKYRAAPAAFEQLKQLIVADVRNRECLEIGEDLIGDFWKAGSRWSRDGGSTRVFLLEALASVHMSAARYAEYQKLFFASGTQRVGTCRKQGVQEVWVVAYRHGLVSGGCTGDIRWSPVAPPATEELPTSPYRETRVLENGWFMEFVCT